jgi:hypothetical protein
MRGESNPCFVRGHLRVSTDVLLEGTRERSEKRGLPRMAPDVITFVITIPVYGQCLETIKFAISYRVFQGGCLVLAQPMPLQCDRNSAGSHNHGWA